jgi:hypothetical protein
MSMRIRAAVGSAILVCAWSCQVGAMDAATIYSSLPEPDPAECKVNRDLGTASSLEWPTPHPWTPGLQGAHELALETRFTSLALWGAAGPAGPDLEYSLGGARSRSVPSCFHMVTKGSALIVGFELAMMGVMMAMPRESMKWEPDFVQDATRNVGNHITSAPVWDEDDWKLNYLGHPYAGSLYYNTVRAQGASVGQSFLFALGASTFWEYFVEATAEPASTQDLIVTPVAGAILGELVHRLTLSMKKNGTSFLEGIVITVLNPTHVVMRGYR